jgi:tetratricopeptide (TPR) repeat protein
VRPAIGVTLCLSFGVASAEPTPTAPTAESYYEAAVRFYDAGDYDRAIEAFKQAHALRPRPSLLYNIAQAYRQRSSSTCGLALEYYRAYLREKPDTSDRELILEHIEAMEACKLREPQISEAGVPIATTVTPVEPTPPPIVAPVPEPTGKPFPGVLVGIGGATLVAGGVLQGVVRWKFASLRAECPCPRETWESWRVAELASYGALAVGGALVATALVHWRWSAAPDTSRARIVPTATPTGLGVAVAGEF